MYQSRPQKGKQLDSIYWQYRMNKTERAGIEADLLQRYKNTKDKEISAFIKVLNLTIELPTSTSAQDELIAFTEERYTAFPNLQARCLQIVGYHNFIGTQNYEKAFDAYMKLEKLLYSHNQQTITDYANYCAEIAAGYYKFRNYKKAIELGKKGSQYASNKWDFYNTIGLCYLELHEADSSIHYLQKAVSEAEVNKMPNVYRTISIGNLGYNYYIQKKYNKAKQFIQTDLTEAIKIKDYGLAAGAAIPLADIYLTEKNWIGADRLLASARSYIAESNQVDRLEKFFPVRSRYYQLTGNLAFALKYRDSAIRAIRWNDSSYNGLLVMRVQQRTDMEKLAEEKSKLESYKKVSQIRIIAITVVFITLLIIILLIRHYRSRIEKDKKHIEELNRIMEFRQKLSADMHDDIGSTLSSISLYTQSLLMQPQVDTQRNTLEKIKQNAQNVQESVSDIIWSVNPIMDSMEQVIARMRAFGADMTEHAGILFCFFVDDKVSSLSLDMDRRKNLYLIYKEIINNAVKYSGSSKVNVLLKQDVGAFFMSVEDEGVGFNVAAKSRGNGVSNMRKRAQEVDADLIISSVKYKGTSIKLVMPL